MFGASRAKRFMKTGRSYQLKHLSPRHYQVLELMLRGWTQQHIARELAISTRAIRTAQASPIFQDELARRRRDQNREVDRAMAAAMADVARKSAEAALMATKRQAQLLESSNPRVASTAAKAILDVAMGRPKR